VYTWRKRRRNVGRKERTKKEEIRRNSCKSANCISSDKYLKAGDCVTDSADATYQHSTFILVPSYLKEGLLSTTRNDQTISIVSKFSGHRSR